MLDKDDNVKVEVFAITGDKVVELLNGFLNAGLHTLNWDAASVPSGIYFYTITTSDSKTTRKMTLLK